MRKYTSESFIKYDDSLTVTNVDDLADYLYSLTSMTTLNQVHHRDDIHKALAERMEDGVLNVQKEYSMFVRQ